ncbi:lysine 2,3-aminomutase related protein [Sulfuricella denitrificans skB26]|uniref:Lysine 2,3-aminomutase related protein n=1 Tax=Sulfuricella denitrificans (strain DSM 22764 / NBRC 105220 / skB26) TaxID=1163617 RepID=S6AAM3_SULDS|nr:lysine 2,3-aminomutase [Sulfuricella denitrificans]BAN33873.1 lysine 2,3-aminomutase related protein [Sulfuricella denitrificans skB26]
MQAPNANVPAPTLQKPQYKSYLLNNFRDIPQMSRLSEQQKFDIEVVGSVLPFKANNFVVEQLIDWDNIPNDPIFVLTFPQRDMLLPEHYDEIAALLKQGADKTIIREAANRIRMQLNPHPAGQIDHNVPVLNGERLHGMQHKYRQTVLFFPSQGQTCHAYCTFCFRWPQFVGMSDFKFASREIDLLIAYLREHPEVTDVLFTGGDPMIMSAKNLASYLEPLIQANLPNLRRIRIGTKALGYWPYKFVSDDDTEDLLDLFRKVSGSGLHLALMAHFNHPRELEPEVVREAIRRIRETGAEIRTQSPVLRHINDDPATWARMWNAQVDLGCIPYYMFVARDTGAQHYFSVPLERAWQIFREAYQQVSGLCRTVRGPSMSANPGKVQLLGVSEAKGEKIFTLRFLQGRDPDWVQRPFFAAYDDKATWLDDLKPAFGEEKFFFEEEMEQLFREKKGASTADDFE